MTRLLPPASPPTGTPTFAMKVSGDLQQLLARNSLRLKLIVKNGQFSLKAGSQVYELDMQSDLSPTEVFKHLSMSTLQSIGTVKTRLQISTPISSPASTSSISEKSSCSHSLSHRDTSSATLAPSGNKLALVRKRLIQRLCMAPINREELIRRTRLPAEDVDFVLKSVAMAYDPYDKVIQHYPGQMPANDSDALFVLDYNQYQEVKFHEWKYPERFVPGIKRNCELVFDYLKYPESHPARIYAAKSGGQDKRDELKQLTPPPEQKKSPKGLPQDIPKGPRPVIDKKVEREKVSPPQKTEKRERSHSPQKEKSVGPSKQGSQSTAQIQQKVPSPKKRKSSEDSYLEELARRFQKTYKEYESLYKSVNLQKQRDEKELKRLFELHRNLETWKKQLWNSVATE